MAILTCEANQTVGAVHPSDAGDAWPGADTDHWLGSEYAMRAALHAFRGYGDAPRELIRLNKPQSKRWPRRQRASSKAKRRQHPGAGEERSTSSGGRSSDAGMSDAFVKLLQSPLVAELVAVAATAAL
jgi:hypothetical protein